MQISDWTGREISNGRYRVERKLGQGGFAEIYLARDRKLERPVVLKVPRLSWLEETDFAERYRREIRAMVTLVHPHIVRIYDIGEYQDRPFAVLEYLDAGTLADRLKHTDDQRGQMHQRLQGWLPQISSALDFIHGHGMVHRDVKPSNIIFDRNGHAFLSDFGVAKVLSHENGGRAEQTLTATGYAMGTAEYMAPELCGGKPVDGCVDQYALGVTVFEALSGRRPLEGPTPLATIGLQLTAPPTSLGDANPQVPPEAVTAVDRSLSKDPAERFSDCVAFSTAVLSGFRISAVSLPPAAGEVVETPAFTSMTEDPASAEVRPSEPSPDTASSQQETPVTPEVGPQALYSTEVSDRHDNAESDPDQIECLELDAAELRRRFAKALRHEKRGEWHEAILIYDQLSRTRSDDATYARQCAARLQGLIALAPRPHPSQSYSGNSSARRVHEAISASTKCFAISSSEAAQFVESGENVLVAGKLKSYFEFVFIIIPLWFDLITQFLVATDQRLLLATKSSTSGTIDIVPIPYVDTYSVITSVSRSKLACAVPWCKPHKISIRLKSGDMMELMTANHGLVKATGDAISGYVEVSSEH